MIIISTGKLIADTAIVSDVICKWQNVMACGHTIFMAWSYPLNNRDVIW